MLDRPRWLQTCIIRVHATIASSSLRVVVASFRTSPAQRFAALSIFIVVSSLALYPCELLSSDPVSFRNQIAPLLLENCTACHGPKKAEGGYRVDSFAQLSKAGDSGISPLTTAGAQPSELVRRLVSTDAGERMPAERDALSAEAIELFSRWQSDGSRFDGDDPQAPIFDLIPARDYPAAPDVYKSSLPITALAFTADGSQILASGYHELTVWETATGQLKRRISNLPQRISALDWKPNQQLLAVAGGSPGHIGEVRIVEWESGQVIKTFGRASDVIQAVRFGPGGAHLATGNSDGTVRWFDTSDWRQVRSVASHADSVADIAWSHDGRRIASASRDKTAKVVGVESAELVITYSAHAEPVTGVFFNDTDKEITSTGADRKVHRWQIEDGKTLVKLDLPGISTRLSVERTHAWLGLTDRTVRQLEIATTKLSRQLDGHTAWVTSVSTHAGTNQLVTGAADGEVRLWKLDDGALIRRWVAAPGK